MSKNTSEESFYVIDRPLRFSHISYLEITPVAPLQISPLTCVEIIPVGPANERLKVKEEDISDNICRWLPRLPDNHQEYETGITIWVKKMNNPGREYFRNIGRVYDATSHIEDDAIYTPLILCPN